MKKYKFKCISVAQETQKTALEKKTQFFILHKQLPLQHSVASKIFKHSGSNCHKLPRMLHSAEYNCRDHYLNKCMEHHAD